MSKSKLKEKDLICSKCGKTVKSMLCEALLMELGCKVSPPHNQCYEGQEHDLITIKEYRELCRTKNLEKKRSG